MVNMGIIFHQIIRHKGGVLALSTGTGPVAGAIGSQGLLTTAPGEIYASTTGPPTHWAYGLPFTSNGRLFVEEAAITHYDQGLPFTASGALAVAGS